MRELLATMRGRIYILFCRYFRKNVHIAHGLKIYRRFHLGGYGKVFIGENCIIDGIIGDNKQFVTLDTYCPSATINIGNNARLYAARIAAKFHIQIGNEVLIEEAGITDSDFHSIDKHRLPYINESLDKCRIILGDRVSVGARTLILKGVKIGDDVMVGPGSIVTKSLPSGSIALGNPARPITWSSSDESEEE